MIWAHAFLLFCLWGVHIAAPLLAMTTKMEFASVRRQNLDHNWLELLCPETRGEKYIVIYHCCVLFWRWGQGTIHEQPHGCIGPARAIGGGIKHGPGKGGNRNGDKKCLGNGDKEGIWNGENSGIKNGENIWHVGYRNSLSNSPCPLGGARGRGLI